MDSVVFFTLALLVVGLLTSGFAIEIRNLTQRSASLLCGDNSPYSPSIVNVSDIKYHSDHKYYRTLRSMPSLQPPLFHGNHAALCRNQIQLKRKYRTFSNCLPISGRKDAERCSGADRMNLLEQNSSDTICHASVLHMLLVEVYEELQELEKSSVVLYGSLLGAVRDKGVIPFTEDADIG
ncbi:hypothetical protein PHYSODRAFT_341400 [Phytophthora sojae]|uniref:Uncharacterized protein n=1 Tax=Phytophthora sojae (strain P6497) TaxID=1094619 RepID=G5AD44_PHYSP|nr:hypothetical protein PHYSODRAFT_341400 [Phytophthora sojae]EGZ06098.1 hypothetical protein PHYSODRAFT_341400 [Phytophthora sojae]|eukprot:XP_009537995.1 hypothetical protein PHYSODRAFT_341400 [Phytophthora sojae]